MSLSNSQLNEKDRQSFSEEIANNAGLLGIELSEDKIERLLDYLELFIKWNKTYNLSAIRTPKEMLSKHLLDSLSIGRFVTEQRYIDVGTGGGLPGIPLAILYPQKHFTLLDSAGKKMRFLFQVKQSLSLDNVEIQNLRVESFQPKLSYDGVISRAFASIADMLKVTRHLLVENGVFLAMKGVYPNDELSELGKHYIVESCESLDVPGIDAERHLIKIKKAQNLN